jgi:hypothetical protein
VIESWSAEGGNELSISKGQVLAANRRFAFKLDETDFGASPGLSYLLKTDSYFPSCVLNIRQLIVRIRTKIKNILKCGLVKERTEIVIIPS